MIIMILFILPLIFLKFFIIVAKKQIGKSNNYYTGKDLVL